MELFLELVIVSKRLTICHRPTYRIFVSLQGRPDRFDVSATCTHMMSCYYRVYMVQS